MGLRFFPPALNRAGEEEFMCDVRSEQRPSRRWRFAAIAATAMSSLLLSATGATAQVLLWEESNDNLAVTAANNAGLAPTVVTSEAAFNTAFSSGGWAMVVIDQPANGIGAATATSLQNYITGGGRVLLGYWDMDGNFDAASAAILRPAFGVASATEYTTPLPVSVWNAGHPIFNNPNAIPGTIPTDGTEPWLDDGDRFTVAAGGTALAGFVAAPTPGQAALIQANGGRTIVHGFMSDNMDGTIMTNLLHNEMRALIPEPGTGALITAAGSLLLFRRRRSA
jgi:hypothetical protein